MIGLLRLRNQKYLLDDTLRHMFDWCHGIAIWDDASTDGTYELAEEIMKGTDMGPVWQTGKWCPDQQNEQGKQREMLFDMAAQHFGRDNWFCYVDADERLEWYPGALDSMNKDQYYRMWLFDSYLTPDDYDDATPDRVVLDGLRKWWGPEFREITFAWWGEHCHWPTGACIRQPQCSGTPAVAGLVRHYGKSISVEEWERKCGYYANHVPALADKWSARKGHGLHTQSDQGNKLQEWGQIRLACESIKNGYTSLDESILEVIHV